jgi:hypothetical protein
VPGESPMTAVTSSVTAAMRSPKVVLMVSGCLIIFRCLMCGRFRISMTGRAPINAESSCYADPIVGVSAKALPNSIHVPKEPVTWTFSRSAEVRFFMRESCVFNNRRGLNGRCMEHLSSFQFHL